MSAVLDNFVVQGAAQTEQDKQRQPHTPKKSLIPLHPMQKSAAANEKVGEGFGSTSMNDVPPLPPIMNKYAHLPTPQSPNNFNRTVGPPHTPESPMFHATHPSRYPLDRSGPPKYPDGTSNHSPARSQQIMTPDSSPFMSRYDTTTPQYNPLSDTPTRPTSSSVKMETLIAPYTPSHRTPSPSPSEPPHSSRLSSPFMAKATVSDSKSKNSRISSKPPGGSAFVDDVFSSSTLAGSVASSTALISTPPISPPAPSVPGSESPSASITPPPTSATSVTNEMDRIRQVRQQEHDALESRRPEYLKRTKRTLSEADPTAFVDDEHARDRDRLGSVGIMESPAKGRRIKLFQETSEESFEESLMAGGYGRYRTAEWVRQPQPVVLPTPGPAGPSNVIARLEEAEQQPPVPPSEKELKKQRRLAAFRSNNGTAFSKLFPVELEGKGRVLLDVPNSFDEAEIPSATPKKRGNTGGKRKKKAEPSAKEKRALAAAAAAEEMVEKPNWPDAEFPWRLRTEERAEQAKAEEEERLKWIERFLDRDTDEEDDGDGGSIGGINGRARSEDDEEVLPSSQWGMIYEDEDEHPVPYRAGRGKMVPLAADPTESPRTRTRRSVYFPSDPADARAALLSKKCVRALSYRRQRRHRKDDDESEEVLCICRGTDDGRELVQCDECKMWYHLECIGISIADLGREEDPWYCHDCDPGNVSEPEVSPAEPYSEPDFAPTEEAPPRVIRPADTPFFQSSIQDSPTQPWSTSHIPKTPTRGSGGSSDFGSGFTSSTMSSRLDSSRHGPTTPRHRIINAHVYSSSTPGPFDAPGYDESPFDPTSTPSRGIKFNAPFATPKNSVFSSRAFQTPSRPSARGFPGSASFGAAGFLSSVLSDRGNSDYSPYPRLNGYDDSPVRRTKSTEGPRARRILEPTASARVLFEDASELRAKGKEKALDFGDSDAVL